MTDLTDESVKALLDGATPGPWRADGEPWNRIVWSSADNRVCFMAHSSGLNDARDTATSNLVAAAPDLARALLDARAELAAAQQREAGLVERAEKAEAERDKWFEGAGAHHAASMQQAQRADIAEAELAAAQQREAVAYRDGWRFAYRQCLATGSVPDPDYKGGATLTPTDPGDGWTWNERLGWIGPDGKPADPRRRG